MIQFSGMTLTFDLYNADGERVVELLVGGRPIEPERLYSIASVHTRFQNNLLFGAQAIDENGPVFVEALIEYIRANSPLKPTTDRRNPGAWVAACGFLIALRAQDEPRGERSWRRKSSHRACGCRGRSSAMTSSR